MEHDDLPFGPPTKVAESTPSLAFAVAYTENGVQFEDDTGNAYFLEAEQDCYPIGSAELIENLEQLGSEKDG
ncbi:MULTISPECIES: hypothetical protein [Caproicibacterium]|uniref:Uncharacterized protein n=1 Tax=Caproicibacterium argilliputei TaxID=3030016 RepID=A0AA97D8Q7_9FIRM|nr:hypothetical protein [Caproicibacterium argilliputei]WOC32374.1 hypothetical protein PXC00_00470 [Caproicibacterium argilliputei]